MADVFRLTYTRPIPVDANIITRRGERVARWEDGRGRTRTAPLTETGDKIVQEYENWYYYVTVASGQRVRERGFKDKEATRKQMRDRQDEEDRKRAGLPNYEQDAACANQSFEGALELWLADLRRRGKSKAYVYNMGLLTRRLGRECHWTTLAAIRSDALTTWLSAPEQQALSGRSLNQYLETARAFVNWCCNQKPPWLPGNPLAKIDKADESVKKREKRALRLMELNRLRIASGGRWVIYLTAALTGLRRSELKRLQWGDLHLDGERPHITLRAEATKAKRADMVAINAELLEALKAHKPANAGGGDPVFRRVPKYQTYRNDVKRASIAWRDDQNRLASFHCLRKTFITYLALAEVPVRVAMEMARVTDMKLLNNIYTDAQMFNKSAAAARLPRLHNPDEEPPAAEVAAG